jgi:hypothetical protein
MKLARSAPAASCALEAAGRWDSCFRRLRLRRDHSTRAGANQPCHGIYRASGKLKGIGDVELTRDDGVRAIAAQSGRLST